MASAHTLANRGKPPPTRRKTSLAPSKSCTSAGSTARPQISPSVSTSRCRLRPAIFFPRVVALGAAGLGGLDGLAVDDGPAGGVLFALEAAEVDPQDVVDLLEEALVPPGVEVVADQAPGREVVRQHPPGAARAGQVEQGVDDLPAGVGAASSGLAGGPPLRREEVLDVLPLHVGQVARVTLSGAHTPIVGTAPATGKDPFLDGHSGRTPPPTPPPRRAAARGHASRRQSSTAARRPRAGHPQST